MGQFLAFSRFYGKEEKVGLIFWKCSLQSLPQQDSYYKPDSLIPDRTNLIYLGKALE